MRFLRALISHRAVTALLLTCALMMRIVVPSGFMPSAEAVSGAPLHFTVQICDGASATTTTIALPNRAGTPHKTPAGHVAGTCPYAVLALAVLDSPAPQLGDTPPPALSPTPQPPASADHTPTAPTGLPPSHAPPASV